MFTRVILNFEVDTFLGQAFRLLFEMVTKKTDRRRDGVVLQDPRGVATTMRLRNEETSMVPLLVVVHVRLLLGTGFCEFLHLQTDTKRSRIGQAAALGLQVRL